MGSLRQRQARVVILTAAVMATGLCGVIRAAGGTWTGTTTGTWGDSARWVDGIIADGADSTSIFATDITADTTVHLDTPRTIGNVTFSDPTPGTAGSWIVDNNGTATNVLTLATTTGSPTITVDSLGTNKIVTLSLVLDGTQGLTKAGTGTLFLSGANTYTGTTTVSTGILQAQRTASLPGFATPGAVSVAGGATLAVNVGGSGQWTEANVASLLAGGGFAVGSALGIDPSGATGATYTYASVIGGSQGLNKVGTGTLVLNAANTYTGLTTVTTGTLLAPKTSFLPGFDTAGRVTVLSGATLTANVGGAGQWAPADVQTLLGTGAFTAGSVLGLDTTNATSPYTWSSAIAGTQGLAKAGTGTLVMAASNTYAGNTNVVAGTLNVTSGGSISGGPLTVLGTTGQNFTVDGGSVTFSGTSSINGNSGNNAGNAGRFFLNSGSASFDVLQNDNQPRTIIQINGGTFTANTMRLQRSSNSAVDYTSGFIFAGGNSTIGNAIVASNNSWGSMSVEGGNVTVTGTLTVGNQVTSGRGGGLRVTSGSLTAGELVLSKTNGTNANNVVSATFSGGITALDKLTLGFDNTVNNGSITVNLSGGSVYVGAGGIVQNATINPSFTLSAGTLGAKADFSANNNLVLSGNTAVIKAADVSDVPHDITLDGVLSGAGALQKTGGGTLFLNGANTYSGGTTVAAGALVGSAGAIRGDVINSGSVNFAQSADATYSNVVSGTGSVTKSGSGTLVMSAPQTYTGSTSVTGGVLKLSGSQGTGGVTVANGAGLAIAAGGATVNALTFGGGPGDVMTLNVNDGLGISPVTVTANNGLIANGTTTIGIGVAGITHTGLYTLLDYAGSIGGAGFGGFSLAALPPRVTASLFDNAANTSVDLNVTGIDFPVWTGTVAGGAWDINSTQNWKEFGSGNATTYLQNNVPGDQVLFNDSATGTTTVQLNTIVSPTLVTFANGAKSYTLTGTGKITGPTGLVKSGTGSVTLANTGGNDFTGTTGIQAGTLILGNDNVLSPNSVLNIGSGGTLDVNGRSSNSGPLTLSGNIIGGGQLNAASYDLLSGSVTTNLTGTAGITKSSAGTVVLNSNNSYSGNTDVQAGVLAAGVDNALPTNTTLTLGSNGSSASVDLAGHNLTVGRLNSAALASVHSITNSSPTPATLTINGGDTTTASSSFGGSIDGAVAVLFSAASVSASSGTLSLTGDSTYTGGTTLNNGGILAIASDASLGAVPATPTANLTFTDFTATLRALSTDISLAATRKISNGTTLNLDSNGGANTMTINGVIEGGFVNKVGNGTVVLTNANTFGSMTVTAGNLRITNNDALGSGAVTVGTASLQLGDGVTLSNALTSTSTSAENQIDVPGAGATATYSGAATATGAQIRMAATGAGATLVWTGTATLNNVVVMNQGNIVLQGTGSINASGTAAQALIGRPAGGTQTVSLTVKDNASASFGSLTDFGNARSVSAATLTLQDNGAYSTGGTFNLLDTTATTATSTINLNGGTLTSGAFLKTSTGANQTSTINFNGGTLKPNVSSAAFLPALANAAGKVQNGGAIVDTNGFDVTVALPLSADTGSTGGITKNGAGVLTLGAVDVVGPLTVNAGSVALSAAARIKSLAYAAGTRLDVNTSALVLTGSTDSALVAALLAGRNGGTWNGDGIVSAAAAANANHLTAIGWAHASDLGVSSWSTITGLAGTDLLTKYTYYGDLNLDGRVDGSDFALIDRGAARHLTGWINGDVNYDGSVGVGDYFLMDTAFGLQSGVLSPGFLAARETQFGGEYVASLVAAVPEPASVSLLASAALMIGRRRSRRSRNG